MIATETSSPLVRQMPADEYHAETDWLSNSMFKTALEDPRLFEAQFITKTYQPGGTKAQDMGTVGHAAILEPHVIEDVCLAIPREALNADGHRKGSAWKEFKEANGHRILLNADEMRQVRGMFEACYRHPIAKRFLLSDGPTEDSIFWTCPLSGLKRRVRPDKIVDGWGWVNVKTTTAGIDPEAFRRTMRNFRYDLGQEFYRDAMERLYGERQPHIFIVVEQNEPHRVRVYELSEAIIAIAREVLETGLLDFSRRMEQGDWSNESESKVLTIE